MRNILSIFTHTLAGLLLLFAPVVSNAATTVIVDDPIPAGSLNTWTYEPWDPCTGTRTYKEIASPFDGSTAMETFMGGCGWTCGSFNMFKDYNLGATFDKNTSKVTFDAKFEQLRSPTSHNRSQLYFQFFKNGALVKHITYGYDRFGAYSNVPPGGFASGTWQIDLSTLPSNPDTMRVKSHTRSCVAGDGRVTWDNIKVTSTSPAGPGPSVMVFQPSGGLNDGTDQGGATSGKDTFDLHNQDPATANADNSAAPQQHHFNSNCNSWWGQSYYQFDLATLPAAADTTNVKLIFYHNIGRGYGWPYQISPTTMQARVITSPWGEKTLNYNNRPSINPAVAASVDIPTTSAGFSGFVTLDITNLYKDWKNGVIPNYGIAYSRLQAFCENANSSMVFSSDNPDSTKRPRLEITYNTGPANNPPVADAGLVQTLESTGATTSITLNGSASSDPDGDPLSYSWAWTGGSALGVSPVVHMVNGIHNITLTVNDGKGGVTTATTTVTVQDTIAPTVTIAPFANAEASSASGAVVDVTPNITTADVCAVSLNISPVGVYALGATTVTVTATDCAGNAASATTIVHVVDTTAPVMMPPAAVAVVATGLLTTVPLPAPAVTDFFGPVSLINNAPLTFPLGLTTVTWTATDANGNASTATQTVTVNVPDVALMTAAQITLLTPAQLALLSPLQVSGLPPLQLAAMTPVQLAVVSGSLTPVQIASLTPAQVAALTSVQVALVFGSLTPAQIALLTPAQWIGSASEVNEDEEHDDHDEDKDKDKKDKDD